MHASISGYDYLGTYSLGNSYGSYPYASADEFGNSHLGYRDWDGVTAAGHSVGGGAAWYSRNGGTPVMLAAEATEGGQIQDVFPLAIPGTENVVIIIRTYEEALGPEVHHRALVSEDQGMTFAAGVAINPPDGTGYDDGTSIWAFTDFALNLAGDGILGLAYGAGETYLCQSFDGLVWEVISQVHNDGCEGALHRFEDGRLLVLLRNNPNGSPGLSCYSDDDGLTFSPVIQPNPNANSVFGNNFCIGSPPRGIVRDDHVLVLGRYIGVSAAVWQAQWVIDRNGRYVSGPSYMARLFDPSSGGYWCFHRYQSRWIGHSYHDYKSNGGDARAFSVNVSVSG